MTKPSGEAPTAQAATATREATSAKEAMSAREAEVLAISCHALASHAGIQADRVDVDQLLSAVPGMESVKALRAITEVEDRCGVTIPDDFLFEKATVRAFASFVASLMDGEAAQEAS